MNILIYSTNSNSFDGSKQKVKTIPSYASSWKNTADMFPEHNFIIATQKPGMFILDMDGNSIAEKADRISYNLIPEGSYTETAQYLAGFNPDIAIAASFYTAPFDWLTIQDAMIAEELSHKGIKTICHPVETALNCFDKYRTHNTLKQLGINTAKAVYVHHDLFINAGNRREINTNIYRESVFYQIKNLKYPVIIKDTVGLSSYGMQVVDNYDQARNYLLSKRNNSDRIIEELIEGEQFGTEIYGSDGQYTVMDPLMFSVNQYGITSPKQSIKAGPVTSAQYKTDELKAILTKAACEMKFSGIAQVDLVFSKGSWYVIEINPRLSGMTSTYACMTGKSISSIISDIALNKTDFKSRYYVMNIKFPLLNEEQINKLYSYPFVHYINQIENMAALQIREMGYCEVVIASQKSVEDLSHCLNILNSDFADVMEESFYQKANCLFQRIK